MIQWPPFNATAQWEAFDAASEFRYYQDPGVDPGKIKMFLNNDYAHDHADFVVDKYGSRIHLWKMNRKGDGVNAVHGTLIDNTGEPLDYVWIGHHKRDNIKMSSDTGWTFEWRRTK